MSKSNSTPVSTPSPRSAPSSVVAKSKALTPSSLPASTEEKQHAALKGSPVLLRTAWIVLVIWVLMLAALALHVLGVWEVGR